VQIGHPTVLLQKPKKICKSAKRRDHPSHDHPALHMVLLQFSQRNALQRSTCIDGRAWQRSPSLIDAR
jgi:hypothetical protein